MKRGLVLEGGAMRGLFSLVLMRPEIPHNTGAIGRGKIPMPGERARSINLANAVSIAAYECYRQVK